MKHYQIMSGLGTVCVSLLGPILIPLTAVLKWSSYCTCLKFDLEKLCECRHVCFLALG